MKKRKVKTYGLLRRLLAVVITFAMIIGCFQGMSFSAKADGDPPAVDGPTLLEAEVDESDGVVYYITRVMGTGASVFIEGNYYMFVPTENPKPYMTILPDGSGILKVAPYNHDARGWEEFQSNAINCWVDVVRATDGFDWCMHGTLNYGPTEYNCWAGGAQHVMGAAYKFNEYKYGSKIIIHLSKNSVPWKDATVAIYRGNQKLKEIEGTESLTTGSEEITDGNTLEYAIYDFGYFENGTYSIYVNGKHTDYIKVSALADNNIDAGPGTAKEEYDNFRYITDLSFIGDVQFHTLTAHSTYNQDQNPGYSEVPGRIDLSYDSIPMTSGNATVTTTIYGTNNKEYNVVIGGTDTGHILGNGVGREHAEEVGEPEESTTVNFYNMKVTLNSDQPWPDTTDVSLRDAAGTVKKTLKRVSDSGNEADGYSVVFEGLMQEDEAYQDHLSPNPSTYYVYVNGKYINKNVWRAPKTIGSIQGWNKAKQPYPYETEAEFYMAEVDLKLDDANWDEATVVVDNGRDNYTMTNKGGGVYSAQVMKYLNSNDQEIPYTVSIEGVIDHTNTDNKITGSNEDSKKVSQEFYTVHYKTYVKSGRKYKEKPDDYRKQFVRKNSTAEAPSDAYMEGLSFRWYSPSRWTDYNEEDDTAEVKYSIKPAFDYGATANVITGQTTLYAQFGIPEVLVNEYIRTGANGGTPLANGEYFRLGNLAIYGFGVKKEAIKSAQVKMKNVSSVKVLKVNGVEAWDEEVTPKKKLKAGESISGNVLNLTFNPGLSMAEAQEWLRTNLVFTPVKGSVPADDEGVNDECKVEVTVSDGVMTEGFTTSNTLSDTPTTITQLTGGRSTTLQTGFYYVDSDVTYNGGLEIAANATVRIYVKEDCTLTTIGTAASGATGGKAGITLPSGAKLYLLGKGSLIATGGKAANGSRGGQNVANAYVHSDDMFCGGTGGTGGVGGGGAGAGIGGDGGTGGYGGGGGSGNVSDAGDSAYGGNSGGTGGAGTSGNNMGDLFVQTSLTINATAGANGDSGGAIGPHYTDASGIGGSNYRCNDSGSGWSNSYYAGAGGAGGGGGAGGTAHDIGGGGPGGGGGGGGNGGNCTSGWGYSDGAHGRGGSSPCNKNGSGGEGGAGGSYGVIGSDGTTTPDTFVSNDFIIKYGNVSTINYQMAKEKTIIFPDYNPEDKYYLLGWQVTNYAKYIGSDDGEDHPLTTADKTLYQPGDKLTLVDGTAGDIIFTPILREKTGIDATGTYQMLFKEEQMPETQYYTYTIFTTLDSDPSTEMGALVLTNTDDTTDTISLSAGPEGKYTTTISQDKIFDITSGSYPEITDLGSVKKGESIYLSFETIKVKIVGNSSTDVKLYEAGKGPEDVLEDQVKEGPTLSLILNEDGVSTWQHVRKTVKEKGSYDVYVDGVKVPTFIGSTRKTASYGKGKEVTSTFCTNTLNVHTNTIVNQVELRSSSETIALAGRSNTNWFVTRIQDSSTNYDIYINGLDAGLTTNFASDRTLTGHLYILTVNTRIDGSLADVDQVTFDSAGRVTESGEAVEKAMRDSVGVYTLMTTSSLKRTVTVGPTEVGKVDTTNTLGGSTLVADFYTASYKNGTSEDAPSVLDKDNKVYFKGSTLTVGDGIGAEHHGIVEDSEKAASPENSYFAGWKVDGSIKTPGDTVTVNGTKTLVSAWKLFSTAEARWVIGGKTYYGTFEEAIDTANDKVDDESEKYKDGDGNYAPTGPTIDIYIQGPVIIKHPVRVPVNTTITIENPKTPLYEKKEITAEDVENDETNTLDEDDIGLEVDDTTKPIGNTQGGTITIEGGGTIINYGTINNDNTTPGTTGMTVKEGGVIHNKYVIPKNNFGDPEKKQSGGTINNKGKLTVVGSDSRIENEGIFRSTGENDIPSGGFENSQEPVGQAESEAIGGTLPRSGGKDPLNGMGSIDDSSDPVVIRLEGDVTLNTPLIINSTSFDDKRIVLDLNGFTLTGPGHTDDNTENLPALKVTGTGTNLTVMDSKGGGSIQGGNGTTKSTSVEDPETYEIGLSGNVGLEVFAGDVTIDSSVRGIYGGTGGIGQNGGDAGNGGIGVILSGTSGGTLTLEKGSLIQGGSGGDSMVNNSGTTGKGGNGGSAISDVTSDSNPNKVKLNNQGSLSPNHIDWDNIPLDVTILPGEPGIGYVYTPYVIPENGDPPTGGGIVEQPENKGNTGTVIDTRVSQAPEDSRRTLTADRFTLQTGTVSYDGNAQDVVINFTPNTDDTAALTFDGSTLTGTSDVLGGYIVRYYSINPQDNSETLLGDGVKPFAVGLYDIKITTDGCTDLTNTVGYKPVSNMSIGTFSIVAAPAAVPASGEINQDGNPVIQPVPTAGEVQEKGHTVVIDNNSGGKVTGISIKVGDSEAQEAEFASASQGDTVTISAITTDGFTAAWTVEAGGVTLSSGADGTKSFEMPENDVVIGVSTTSDGYTITPPIIKKTIGQELTNGYGPVNVISVEVDDPKTDVDPTNDDVIITYKWYKEKTDESGDPIYEDGQPVYEPVDSNPPSSDPTCDIPQDLKPGEHIYQCVIESRDPITGETATVTVPVPVNVDPLPDDIVYPYSIGPNPISAPTIVYTPGGTPDTVDVTITHYNEDYVPEDVITEIEGGTRKEEKSFTYELFYTDDTPIPDINPTEDEQTHEISIGEGWTKATSNPVTITGDPSPSTTPNNAVVVQVITTTVTETYVDPDPQEHPENPKVTITKQLVPSNPTPACETGTEDTTTYTSNNQPVPTYDRTTPTYVVEAPVITITPSGDGNSATATITCDTEGASIRFTTDGTVPTSSLGIEYNAGLTTLDQYTRIKAIAYKNFTINEASRTVTSSISSKVFVPSGVIKIDPTTGTVTPLKPGKTEITKKIPENPTSGQIQEDIIINLDVKEKTDPGTGAKSLVSEIPVYTIPYGITGFTLTGATSCSGGSVTVGDGGAITTAFASDTPADIISGTGDTAKTIARVKVAKRPITVKPNSVVYTYTGNEINNFTYTLSGGLAYGDIATVPIGDSRIGAGTYVLYVKSVTIKHGDTDVTSSYAITRDSQEASTATLTINKRKVKVTGITANNKYYDGTTTATLKTTKDEEGQPTSILADTRVVNAENSDGTVLVDYVTIGRVVSDETEIERTFSFGSSDVGTYKISLYDDTNKFYYDAAGGNDEPTDDSQKYVYAQILRRPLTDAMVGTGSVSQVYNGSYQQPGTLVFTDGETTRTLRSGTDYTVNGDGYKDVSSEPYTVSVSGINNYSGTTNVQFTITPRSITGAVITSETHNYNGILQTSKLTSVLVNGVTLSEGTDYEILKVGDPDAATTGDERENGIYTNQATNAGTYTITIKGKGNYQGIATHSFTINRVDSIPGSSPSGDANPPAVEAALSVGKKELKYEEGQALHNPLTVIIAGRKASSSEYKVLSVTKDSDTENPIDQSTASRGEVVVTDKGDYDVRVKLTNYPNELTDTFKVISSAVPTEIKISSTNRNYYDPESETKITVTTDLDEDDPNISIVYTWYRDGEEIIETDDIGNSIPIGKEYTIKDIDVGHVITVSVTAGGETISTSTPIIAEKPNTSSGGSGGGSGGTSDEPTVHDVSGYICTTQVNDSGELVEGDPVENAKVEIQIGDMTIATADTSQSGVPGKFVFTDILDGDYNIVVTYTPEGANEDVTVTKKITVENGEIIGGSTLSLPPYTVNSMVDLKNGAPAVVVGGLDDAALDSMTDAEKNSGATVTVTLTVKETADLTSKPDEDLTPSQQTVKAEQEEIKSEYSGDSEDADTTNVEFLDLSIMRKVEVEENSVPTTTTSQVHETGQVLEIIVPFSTSGRCNIRILRNHEGHLRKFTALQERPDNSEGKEFKDGTFFKGADFVVIYGNLFSTYAICYQNGDEDGEGYYDEIKDEGGSGGGGGGTQSEPGKIDNASMDGPSGPGGEPVIGDVLTVKLSPENLEGIIEYQWYRDGEPIEGATYSSYTITTEDAGKEITVEIIQRITKEDGTEEVIKKTPEKQPGVVRKKTPQNPTTEEISKEIVVNNSKEVFYPGEDYEVTLDPTSKEGDSSVSITDILDDDDPDNHVVYIRTKGTDDTEPSEWIPYPIGSRPEAPKASTKDDSANENGTIKVDFGSEEKGKNVEVQYKGRDGIWHSIPGPLTIGRDGIVIIEGMLAGDVDIRIRFAATLESVASKWQLISEEIEFGIDEDDYLEQFYIIHYILEYSGKQLSESTEPVYLSKLAAYNSGKTYGISANKSFYDTAAGKLFGANDNLSILSYTVVGKAIYSNGTPVFRTGSSTDVVQDTLFTMSAEEFVDNSSGIACEDIPVLYNDLYVYANVGAYATDREDNGVVISTPAGVKYSGLAHKLSADPKSLKADAGKSASYDLNITITDTKTKNSDGTAYELVYGKDYTVSYKNNKNASVKVSAVAGETYYKQIYGEDQAAAKWPQIIVKGKGNYAKMKAVVYFDILPLSVGETYQAVGNYADIVKDSYILKKKGGIALTTKAVHYQRKYDKLTGAYVNNDAKTVKYKVGTEVIMTLQKQNPETKLWETFGTGDVTTAKQCKALVKTITETGSYRIKLTGTGNYYGTAVDRFEVYANNKTMFSKLKVKKATAVYSKDGVAATDLVTAINTKVKNEAGKKVAIPMDEVVVTLTPMSESAEVDETGTKALTAGKYNAFVSVKDSEDFAKKYPYTEYDEPIIAKVTVKASALNQSMFTIDWNQAGEVYDGSSKDIKVTLNGITTDDVTIAKQKNVNGKVTYVPLTKSELKVAVTVTSDSTMTISGSYVLDDGRVVDNKAPGTYKIFFYGKGAYADSKLTVTYKRNPVALDAKFITASDATYNVAGAMAEFTVTEPDGDTVTISGKGNSDYAISYTGNKQIGSGRALIKVKKSTTGYRVGSSAYVDFKINAKTVVNVLPYSQYSKALPGEVFIKCAGTTQAGKAAPTYKLYQASADGSKIISIGSTEYTGEFKENTTVEAGENAGKTYDLVLTSAGKKNLIFDSVTVSEIYTEYTVKAKKYTLQKELNSENVAATAALIRNTGSNKVFTSEDIEGYASGTTAVTVDSKGNITTTYAGGCYILPVIKELNVVGYDGKTYTLKYEEGDYIISYTRNDRFGTAQMTVTLSQKAARKYGIGGSKTYRFKILRQKDMGLRL
ncbi:FN3 associated domain-containing protein [Butyrivibrio sp. DSM 10294]|uniref:FN3 associated domain-containing protein n=1 Tax=Butyrivibrio sp. DSM 10294 TaxID=2972457 RepID=UPI00234EE3FF|nr:FN3 associated domain-containing protein [Butyrivibrio sp. DSM 10294]